MGGRKRPTTRSNGNSLKDAGLSDDASAIYQQMLDDAGIGESPQNNTAERPRKRMRPVQTPQTQSQHPHPKSTAKSNALRAGQAQPESQSESDDEDVEFLDVPLPAPVFQTVQRDSDDETEEEEDEQEHYEDVARISTGTRPTDRFLEEPKDLELNLTALKDSTTPQRKSADRRKPLTREEKERRLDIHKAHLICLLSHVARRNQWCNDRQVQDTLQAHLTDKTVNYLTPSLHLPQFGQAESLKTGLKQANDMWLEKFEIRERGLRKALWAEDPNQLQDYELPEDLDSCLDRKDFRLAAAKLQGSRDVGAQLYCALLRSVGVRARLVCSLQPLAFGSGAPTLSRPSAKRTPSKTSRNETARAQWSEYKKTAEAATASPSKARSARRRLGHPNAASYDFEMTASPPKSRPTFDGPRHIRESAYPVFWVEVLDTGHQKWQPVDPVVTRTFWKPKVLEPPITDKENVLSYVLAFDADGTARDVTVRYAKAYAAKTRRLRVDGVTDDGQRWWRAVMRNFSRTKTTDLDQIENIELAGIEAREPMPRNVQDFKDHPVFALERHLRRHEVLVPDANPSGTVSAGTRGPLEKIYRRRDVRVARTADKWYRLGREVKPNEIPAEWLPKKVRPRNSRLDDELDADEHGAAGTPMYSLDQTTVYEPPLIRNGRVPKNKFGNIEVYVPSMVPRGGVHMIHENAGRAAFLAGVDYAPALTGFSFSGKQGTAVITGVVVAEEYEEGLRAIINGLDDVEQQLEDERRALLALRMWRKFLMALRIRERIWSGVDVEERKKVEQEADAQAAEDAEMDEAPSDVTEEFDMDGDDGDEGGGGFLIE